MHCVCVSIQKWMRVWFKPMWLSWMLLLWEHPCGCWLERRREGGKDEWSLQPRTRSLHMEHLLAWCQGQTAGWHGQLRRMCLLREQHRPSALIKGRGLTESQWRHPVVQTADGRGRLRLALYFLDIKAKSLVIDLMWIYYIYIQVSGLERNILLPIQQLTYFCRSRH